MSNQAAEDAIRPLVGVWKCDNARTENFEEFLQEMGVNFMIRKLAKRGSPTMTISLDDGKLNTKTETGFMTKISSIPLDGSEIDEEYMGGGKAKAHFELVDGKPSVVAIPADSKLKKTVVSREIVSGELVQLIDVGDGKVVCKRVFIKQS